MSPERFRLPEEYLVEALRLSPLAPPMRLEAIPTQIASDCWHVHCGDGSRWVAKFAYHGQDTFETGLKIGALVNAAQGLAAPVALSSHRGRLSEMLEGPPGSWHLLAIMSYVPGTPVQLEDELGPARMATALASFHRVLSDRDRWVPGMRGMSWFPTWRTAAASCSKASGSGTRSGPL